MFTGIVEAIGTVRRATPNSLEIEAPALAPRLALGDSVAVGGVCLTAAGVTPTAFRADVSPETLSKTGLGALRAGSRVNLETALTLEKPLGGHLVTGHVDCQGAVTSVQREAQAVVLRVSFPPRFAPLVVERGSLTVNGVSLTIAGLEEGGVRIALIPHTVAQTTLAEVRAGDAVNLEFDLLGKYVVRRLELLAAAPHLPDAGDARPLTVDQLRELGY